MDTKTYPLSILGNLDEETKSRLIDLQGMDHQEVAILCAERGKFARIYASMATACRAGADDAALGRIFRDEAGFAPARRTLVPIG